jgi:ribonuclease BN (tRNA processing enzyme)
MKMQKRKNELKIIAHKNLIDLFEEFINMSNIYFIRMGFKIQLIPISENERIRLNNDFEFIAKENQHLLKLNRELGIKESKLISLTFLFTVKGIKIFYSGDVESIRDLYLFNDDKIDYLISESTHISLEELIEVYKNINPFRLIITHIEDGIEPNLIKWYNKLKESDKEKIILASDGMKLEL